MTPVHIELSNMLTLTGLTPEVRQMLIQALTIPDPESLDKTKMLRLYYARPGESNGLRVGRGLLNFVTQGLSRLGVPFYVRDNRSWGAVNPIDTQMTLRDYQREAYEVLLGAEQGVLQAPTGSGKTRIGIALAETMVLHQKTLVMVNRLDLATQWIQAGTPAQVRTVQSLTREDMNQYGCVIVDECHHAPAKTYADLLTTYQGRYLFGMSATPERVPGLMPVVESLIGPVVAKVEQEHLVETGIIHKPEVKAIFSDITVPIDSYYAANLTRLCQDQQRMNLVVNTVNLARKNGARKIILMTGRINHCEDLCNNLSTTQRNVWMTHGEYDSVLRKDVYRSFLMDDVSLLVTTLADEALDLPCADAIILAQPNRAKALTQQRVGRLSRLSPGKTKATVYDIVDYKMPVFHSQWRSRRQLYDDNMMDVEVIYAHGGVL